MARRKRKQARRTRRRRFSGAARTCIRYGKFTVRSAAGSREALRCIQYAGATKVGKHPCADSRLHSKRGSEIRGHSPGVMRVRNDNCVR